MVTCTYCTKSFRYSGKMFIRSNGKIVYFCSSKCEKNMLGLKRKAASRKWITKKPKKQANK